jgi:tRNA dimethylallyltransferase
LAQEAKEKGEDFLYQRLKRVDPKTASGLHPRDLYRTKRALEVFDSTGVPISFFREQHHFRERPYQTLKIGLEMERLALYHRIEERVDQMIERGFLQEVSRLMEMGYGAELKPMQSLGYKQMVQFILMEIGWTEAVRRTKRDTRHYAKRQWTWFKSDPEIHWRDVSSDWRIIFEEVKSFVRRGG